MATQIRKIDELAETLGDLAVTVDELRDNPNGIDEGTVESWMAPKSVGHEHTFDRNTLDPTVLESMLLRLCEHVGERLRAGEHRGKTITLKLEGPPNGPSGSLSYAFKYLLNQAIVRCQACLAAASS